MEKLYVNRKQGYGVFNNIEINSNIINDDKDWRAILPALKEEMERQGLEKYISGEYTLNKLDYNGQRINIVIKIPRKDNGEEVSFISGWMVMPNGKIRLATPYGDR